MNPKQALNYSLNGDRQGFLYQEAREILQGKVDKILTDEHIEAVRLEHEKYFPEIDELPF